MILIGGVRPYVTVMATVTLVCGACHNAAAHRLTEEVRKVTVFFIPTVKVRTTYEVQCVYCGSTSPMTAEAAQDLARRARQPGVAPGTVLGSVKPGRRRPQGA